MSTKQLLLTILLLVTPFLVNAGWKETSKGMYEINNMEGSLIINTIAGGLGGHNNRILTTIHTDSGLYRCVHHIVNMKKRNCWVLQSD
jgi:uncharacterized membrane-anchored protein YitT (DUF2179 family)